ncbi:MAG: 4-hydroxy-tetrahydrodipicolinate reductase [Oscillospiraceae bacterium]|nr:4-hydroxy-tetrahydrodipicolinate reductase [Oscillospiraceae bacterium]
MRILMSGCGGRMGRFISDICEAREAVIAAGVDIADVAGTSYPIYRKISEVTETCDVIIDFSYHTAVCDVLEYARAHSLPLVIATTGHTDFEKAKIAEASRFIPIFKSANMSIGVALVTELCRRAAAFLQDDFDIEIVEKHHNKKLDAPSGTALMIADAMNSVLNANDEYIYDRHAEHRPRGKHEIGFASVRGGTIVGEHDVIFAGHDEVITVSHSAISREIFAEGALRAARFIIGKPVGEYDMGALIKEI